MFVFLCDKTFLIYESQMIAFTIKTVTVLTKYLDGGGSWLKPGTTKTFLSSSEELLRFVYRIIWMVYVNL